MGESSVLVGSVLFCIHAQGHAIRQCVRLLIAHVSSLLKAPRAENIELRVCLDVQSGPPPQVSLSSRALPDLWRRRCRSSAPCAGSAEAQTWARARAAPRRLLAVGRGPDELLGARARRVRGPGLPREPLERRVRGLGQRRLLVIPRGCCLGSLGFSSIGQRYR